MPGAGYDRHLEWLSLRAAERLPVWAYGQWAYGSLPVELWRIAPEKFAMSLSTCKNEEPGCDAGMTRLIYLPVGMPSTPYRPPQ
jgi:hypothetical protein